MNFQKIKSIGKGEFGDVYLCQRVETGQMAADKVFEEGTFEPAEIKLIQKRIDEVKVLAHPNIVEIYGYLEINRSLHIFMDYMRFDDLRHVMADRMLSNSSFEDSVVWKFLFQLLSGLNFLHEKAIIHGDLKPTNILLKKKQHYMISDPFMRDIIEARPNPDDLSQDTLVYLAPEVLHKKEIDRKCDIWSLGVILFEMVNLQLPFDPSYAKDFLNKVAAGNHEPFKRNVTVELKQVIQLMLNPERVPRPDCNELLRSDTVKFASSPALRTPKITDLSDLIWNNSLQPYGDVLALRDFESSRIAAIVCCDERPAKIFVLNKRMTYWVPMRQSNKLKMFSNSCVVGLENGEKDGALAVDSYNLTARIHLDLNNKDIGWMKVDGPLQERWSVVGIRRGKKVYFIGGSKCGKKSTVECFDTESLEWLPVLNLPRATWRPAMILTSTGAIMVIGGMTLDKSVLSCAQILSPEGHWYVWENFLPRGNCIISACELNGCIFVFLPDGIYELESGSTQKKMNWKLCRPPDDGHHHHDYHHAHHQHNRCPRIEAPRPTPRHSDSLILWGDRVVMTHKNQAFIAEPRLQRISALPSLPINGVLVRASLMRLRDWPKNIDIEPQRPRSPTKSPPLQKRDLSA